MLLGLREQDEIALGLVGKFWRPVIEFARVSSAAEFRISGARIRQDDLRALGSGLDPQHTLLSGVMRTATTDEDARRWFRRYWTCGVGSRTCSSTACSMSRARWLDGECTSTRLEEGP